MLNGSFCAVQKRAPSEFANNPRGHYDIVSLMTLTIIANGAQTAPRFLNGAHAPQFVVDN